MRRYGPIDRSASEVCRNAGALVEGSHLKWGADASSKKFRTNLLPKSALQPTTCSDEGVEMSCGIRLPREGVLSVEPWFIQ
jgi:hypothetical protein